MKQNDIENTKAGINWKQVADIATRAELQRIARKMRRKGFSVSLDNYRGKFTVEGRNAAGGHWVA